MKDLVLTPATNPCTAQHPVADWLSVLLWPSLHSLPVPLIPLTLHLSGLDMVGRHALDTPTSVSGCTFLLCSFSMDSQRTPSLTSFQFGFQPRFSVSLANLKMQNTHTTSNCAPPFSLLFSLQLSPKVPHVLSKDNGLFYFLFPSTGRQTPEEGFLSFINCCYTLAHGKNSTSVC